jgi:hypothetical protein
MADEKKPTPANEALETYYSAAAKYYAVMDEEDRQLLLVRAGAALLMQMAKERDATHEPWVQILAEQLPERPRTGAAN